MIGRRELILAGVTAVGGMSASSAKACTLIANSKVAFDEHTCRAALAEWIALLNAESGTPSDALIEKIDEMGVEVGDDVLDEILTDAEHRDARRNYTLYTRFRFSDGKMDRAPVKLKEINRIRRLQNRASFQFTLIRHSYHAADEEGCNGLFTHDEFWNLDRKSYLATFWNNRLMAVRLFPEWYLEDDG